MPPEVVKDLVTCSKKIFRTFMVFPIVEWKSVSVLQCPSVSIAENQKKLLKVASVAVLARAASFAS